MNDLGKNLGINLHQIKVSSNSYRHIVGRMQQRLTTWKARTLSFACKLTLTKSVLSALPLYTMQYEFNPRSVYDKLDQLARNFL